MYHDWSSIDFLTGAQETKIICLKKDTNVMVTNENCDPRLKPQSQVLKCNSNICPPK